MVVAVSVCLSVCTGGVARLRTLTCSSVCVCVCVRVCVSVCLSVSVCPSVCLCVQAVLLENSHLLVCLCICLSVCLSVCTGGIARELAPVGCVCVCLSVCLCVCLCVQAVLLENSHLLAVSAQRNGICEVLYAAAWICGEFSE